MQGEGLLSVALKCCMSYLHAHDCVTSDEGDRIADEDTVVSLEQELGGAGVGEAYAVAPSKEVNLPGLVSMGLLTERGSLQSVCNRTSTIN